MHGFTHGFQIGCVGLPPQRGKAVSKLKSADKFAEVIDRKLAKELALGRILGPYDVPPTCLRYRISPLRVVPKKSPGEFRMIHHISYPEGSSVNDFISKEISSVHYATIQDATNFIRHSPKPVYMAKVDVESVFRIIPVSPADRPLLGFSGKGSFYRCCSSYGMFEQLCDLCMFQYRVGVGCEGEIRCDGNGACN